MLRSACRLMVLNIRMKFHQDILNGFHCIERTRRLFTRFKGESLQTYVTRVVTNNCVRSHEEILNSFKVIERT